MNRFARVILGVNAATLPHLAISGPRRFAQACTLAYVSGRQGLVIRDAVEIPEIGLDEILGGRRPFVRLRVTRYEEGMLPTEQAMALLAILVTEQPKEVLEIGTFMGHTTRLMAENLESAVIHTIDLPQTFTTDDGGGPPIPKDDFHLIRRRVVGREFQDDPCRGRIKQHFADTATWDFREAGSPTFFFIDGSHTYEYCKNDSEKCYGLGEGPAVFLWHDCDPGFPGVVKFLMEWRQLGREVRRISGTPLAYWRRD